ncbi:roadblock/LC7 domain-containing protein [Acrocarpospora sp. B8E8]|uniref:roadblock/LC7 domain-containing protein n=1 Tax=Acrocarpospora sp. B8E8 TaxID=3153572 RepID=UPI00325D9F14
MITIEDCLVEAMSIPGALGAILVDHASETAVATRGRSDPERSASGLSEAFRAIQTGLALSSPTGTVRIDDVIITTDQGYQLIRPMDTPVDGPLLICVQLDLNRANLGLARHRLQSISRQLIAS